MNIYELIEKAKTDGRLSHDLREHCANNFLKTFEALKEITELSLISPMEGDLVILKVSMDDLKRLSTLIAKLENVS